MSSRQRHCVRRLLNAGVAMGLLAGLGQMLPRGFADEPPAATDKAKQQPTAAIAEESSRSENDSVIVPDGSVEELFAFIETLKANRRTMAEAQRSARGTVEAAEKIRSLPDISLEDELKALKIQLPAHEFLAMVESEQKAGYEKLVEELLADERPEIQQLGQTQKLKVDISRLGDLSEENQQALFQRVLTLIDEHGINHDAYMIAASLGRSLEGAKRTELAASLYEALAIGLKESDNEQLQAMAPRMEGSARRARVLGNPLQLSGTIGDGSPLNWDQYRGKVVLVDFWASWCGPCRAELPNMKRNLEKYGDRGFAILGINMDNTVEAYEKCIADEAIAWENIVSADGEGRGWEHPMAVYYGISGIPTAILVGRDGKVVSLSARGSTLDKLLAEMIGDNDTSDAESAAP